MNVYEIIKQSLDSLKSNKLRSFLTMLGISIGIAAVIIIVAIGNGGQALITGEFDKLGANIIEVAPKSKNITENEMLTLKDVENIKEAVPQLKNLSPIVQKMDGKVRVDSFSSDAVIVGGNSQLKVLRGIEMLDGTFFTDHDDRTQNCVAVISDIAAKKMYKTTEVLGKRFTYRNSLGSNQMIIVGVYKELNPFAGMMGDEYPVVVLAPIRTVTSIYNSKYVDSILGTIEDNKTVEDVGLRMVKVLDYTHKTKDKYFAQNSADMLKSINKILSAVTLVIGAAAGISLLVGGIGIMNIMLMSVKERTREIGIRKALGARKRDIVVQFLTEAVIMTGLSGIVGIAIGTMIAYIASKIVNVPLPISLGVGIIGFLFSALLGIFFGVYPAKKAADLDPIEALRYE